MKSTDKVIGFYQSWFSGSKLHVAGRLYFPRGVSSVGKSENVCHAPPYTRKIKHPVAQSSLWGKVSGCDGRLKALKNVRSLCQAISACQHSSFLMKEPGNGLLILSLILIIIINYYSRYGNAVGAFLNERQVETSLGKTLLNQKPQELKMHSHCSI